MPAIFRRLGTQTIELCNGRKVNTYHVVDSCVVVESRRIFPPFMFLVGWLVLGLVVNGAMGASTKGGVYDSTQSTIMFLGFLLPLLLFLKRTHFLIRVTGTSGEVLLLLEVPEGEETAYQMVNGLMREVEKSASYTMLEPHRQYDD
jgi:hypothetical protein